MLSAVWFYSLGILGAKTSWQHRWLLSRPVGSPTDRDIDLTLHFLRNGETALPLHLPVSSYTDEQAE